MDVNAPDGKVINFPDSMQKEQVQSAMQKLYPPKEPGFLSRVGTDLSKRGSEVKEAAEEFGAGKIDQGELALRTLGKGVGGSAGDIMGEGIKSAATDLGKSFPGIKAAASDIGTRVANSDAGKNVAAGAKKVGETWSAWAAKHPDAAKDLESVGDLANIIPGGIAAKEAAPVVGAIGSAAKAGAKATKEAAKDTELWKGFKARAPEALDKIEEQQEQQAGKIFESMRNSGVRINPNDSVKMADAIEKRVLQSGKIDAKLHSDTADILKDMKEGAKQGADFEDIHILRQRLREVTQKKFGTQDARRAEDAIQAIDDAVEIIRRKALPLSQQGSKAASDFINGIDQWARIRRFSTISDIIKKADGDPNRIKQLFEQLRNSPKKMRGFPPEERALINQAAENTTMEGLMKMAGKLGITVGTGRAAATGNVLPVLEVIGGTMIHGGGIPGFAAVAGGTAAKGAQKLLAKAKADRLLKKIEEGFPQQQGQTAQQALRIAP